MRFLIMHIILKFQCFIRIFTAVKLKKDPKIVKMGEKGLFSQYFQWLLFFLLSSHS